MKVAIVGFGSVGQAMYHIINNKELISIYDKHIPDFNNQESIIGADIVFMCLPTPNNSMGEQDASAFEGLFHYISQVPNWDPIIVIKSTVLFDNIRPYLERFKIVMNPEFLSQNTSFDDSRNQKVVILGGRVDLLNQVENFYVTQTGVEASYEYMSIQEAIDFKYIRNIYGAYKVLFWNWVQEHTGDARKFADLYAKMPQGEMSQVAADGRPGYGGACFIKDVSAKHKDFPHELTAFLQIYNERLRGTDKKKVPAPKLVEG